jgi:hypothetical protein
VAGDGARARGSRGATWRGRVECGAQTGIVARRRQSVLAGSNGSAFWYA